MKRALLWLAGALALALGIIGLYTPILPTTPLVLLAAACWAKASPRLHAKLLAHPTFGPMVHNWEQHRAIPRKAKMLSAAMMTLSCAWLWWAFPERWYVAAITTVVCAATAVWMWRLPDA